MIRKEEEVDHDASTILDDSSAVIIHIGSRFPHRFHNPLEA